jgi:SAM-dependent methyltransferase
MWSGSVWGTLNSQRPYCNLFFAMFHLSTTLFKKLSSVALRASGRDLTNSGERVDIYYSKHLDIGKLDMYQKSHYKRYEFACRMLGRDMLVGDMACGTGYGTVMMSEMVRHVYACDISPIIKRIRERYRECDRVTFLQSDILLVEDIPQLNAIVSFETVEHLPEVQIEKLFTKFNSFLCTEGILIFSTPFRQPATAAARKHHKIFEIDEAKVNRWADHSGFQIEDYFYQNYSSHEILPSIEPKDFLICVCRKIGSM